MYLISMGRRMFAILAAALALGLGLGTGTAAAQTTPIRSLVLYDAPSGTEFQKLGLAYAIMLRNLLGHWNTSVELKPVDQYSAGQIANYDTVFYLGAYYDNPVPPALIADVANNTAKRVVWFKYNLWQMAWGLPDFSTRFGFSFSGVAGMNEPPSSGNPNPGFFDTVTYKSKEMKKYYQYDAANNAVLADPEIGVTEITDPAQATQLVPITNTARGTTAPYVLRSSSRNFWYVADIPFSYIGPRERYVAFCDLLHDLLGTNLPAQQRALVRLEDVAATVNLGSMRTLSDFFAGRRIPFSIATVPRYEDPLGKYNGGTPQTIQFSAATDLRNALTYAQGRGGKLVLHGWTHQYSNVPNPHTGVTADDFEFWNIVTNRPVAEDSVSWARQRVDTAVSDLAPANGRYRYQAYAFEVPHYQASPSAYAAIRQRFAKTHGRLVYYTSSTPVLSPGSSGRDFAVGQFFPYVIQQDHYGNRVIPENLGNIEYDICSIDPTSCMAYTWEDLRINAEYAKVVRDGFASFFFHPFWLESSLGTPGMQDLTRLVDAITALGYSWVDASGL